MINKNILIGFSAIASLIFVNDFSEASGQAQMQMMIKRAGSASQNRGHFRATTTSAVNTVVSNKVETSSFGQCFKAYKGCMDGRAVATLSKYPDFLNISRDMVLKYYNENNPPQFRCIFDKSAKGIYLNNYYKNSSASLDRPTVPRDGAVNYFQSLIDQMEAFNKGKLAVENLSKEIFKDLRLKAPKKGDEYELKGLTLRIRDLDSELEYDISSKFCANPENPSSKLRSECEDHLYSMQKLYFDVEDNEMMVSQLAAEDVGFISVKQSCKDFLTYSKGKAITLEKDYKRLLKANKASIKKKLERYNNEL
jgi:hypothetical protein